MYKFELNADLREVWLRLAKRFADVAQVEERRSRTAEVGTSSVSIGSMIAEDNDANRD
jgi:hypothetical protein